MREIPLTRNRVAILSDQDYPAVASYKWCATEAYGHFYAVREANGMRVYMHREVAGAPTGLFVHHMNGNTLDNRRDNLAVLTNAEHVTLHHKLTNGRGFGGGRKPQRPAI